MSNTSYPKILGLHGCMGSGKTTALKLIAELTANSHDIAIVKFAEPIYDIQEFIYSRIKSVHVRPKTFVKDRKLLQWIGTDWARDTISQTLWIDLWKAKIVNLTNLHDDSFSSRQLLIVSDDVRFDNEAETVRSASGSVIKITSNRENLGAQFTNKAHKSESGVNEQFISKVIENNSSLEDLKIKLKAACLELGILSEDNE